MPVTSQNTTSAMAASLINGETLRHAANVPMLAFYRPGRIASAPLVVFIPGGGHLARISYGYPNCNPQDFIGHWFSEVGYGFLALSVATGADFPISAPSDLTRLRWAEALAELVAEAAVIDGLPRSVIILVWSMASNVAAPLAVALRKRNITIDALIPMAARPPLPTALSGTQTSELFDKMGFWDVAGSPVFGVPRRMSWFAELEEIETNIGRSVLPSQDYEKYILVPTPFNLRRDPRPSATLETDSDLDDLPLAAPIVPTDQRDFRHALGDVAGWAHVNTQVVRRAYDKVFAASGRSMDAATWKEFSALVADLPNRLSARVTGGHLFFVGERGARDSTTATIELSERVRGLRTEIAIILGEVPGV